MHKTNNIIAIMENFKDKNFEFLREIPERVSITLDFNGAWVCFVDGKPYLVESNEDYIFVLNRLELFVDKFKLIVR